MRPRLLSPRRSLTTAQVEYFKKKRVMETNRATMLEGLRAEGAKEIEMPDPKKPTN